MSSSQPEDDPLLRQIEDFHCGGLSSAGTAEALDLLEGDAVLRDYLRGLRSFDRLFANALGLGDSSISPEPDAFSRYRDDSPAYRELKKASRKLRSAIPGNNRWSNGGGGTPTNGRVRRSWGFGRAV